MFYVVLCDSKHVYEKLEKRLKKIFSKTVMYKEMFFSFATTKFGDMRKKHKILMFWLIYYENYLKCCIS